MPSDCVPCHSPPHQPVLLPWAYVWIRGQYKMVPQSKYLLIGLPVVTLAGIAALWWKQHVKSRSFKEVGSVTGLFVYPVKSCKGIRMDSVKCFKEGMEYDRWKLSSRFLLYLRKFISKPCTSLYSFSGNIYKVRLIWFDALSNSGSSWF